MTTHTAQPNYCDKKGASTFTTLSVRLLDYAKSNGDLPYYRVGRKICFKYADLDRFMESRRIDVTREVAL